VGYPSEIPNAIPDRREPPRRRWWQRAWDAAFAPLAALFRRRKRTRADQPDAYRAGIDPRRTPITSREREKLDVDALADEIARKS